jgi:plastocyanin domain-containing protein
MLVINLLGILLIVFIVWWFWIYKVKTIDVKTDQLVVKVENGVYEPSHLKIKSGQALSIQFFRLDASPCAEGLLFPSLDISETLVLNQHTTVELPPLEVGEYPFYCQMKMYKGLLKVEE